AATVSEWLSVVVGQHSLTVAARGLCSLPLPPRAAVRSAAADDEILRTCASFARDPLSARAGDTRKRAPRGLPLQYARTTVRNAPDDRREVGRAVIRPSAARTATRPAAATAAADERDRTGIAVARLRVPERRGIGASELPGRWHLRSF